MSKKTNIKSQLTLKIRDVINKTIDQFVLLEKENPNFVDVGFVNTVNTALATYQVTDRLQSTNLKTLHKRELNSIYSLFDWVANQQDLAPATVQCITETRFGVADITQLQKKDYEEVIQFLIDLRIDEMTN